MDDRERLYIVAHRAGNDPSALRAALAAGADLVEADVYAFRRRIEVRHARTLGPWWSRRFEVEGLRMAYVFYQSGLAINVLYGVEPGSKRAVGFKLSEGMEVPAELGRAASRGRRGAGCDGRGGCHRAAGCPA